MNFYSYRFICRDPKSEDHVLYTLEIQSPTVISTDTIREACDTLEIAWHHEKIADDLIDAIGGHQTLNSTYQGVEITTIRGVKVPT